MLFMEEFVRYLLPSLEEVPQRTDDGKHLEGVDAEPCRRVHVNVQRLEGHVA